MIPHRQEYPLRKRICPLLADRRQAERALLPSRSSKPCTRTVGVQRADFGNKMFRGPVRLQPVAASTGSSKQHARDTVKWLTMACTTAEPVQRWRRGRSFCFLHLVVVALSLLALSSGSLLLSERMTVLLLFPGSHRPVCSSFWSLFLLVLGLKKKAPKRMVLKIDRRRVVLLSFFSPGTACNSS